LAKTPAKLLNVFPKNAAISLTGSTRSLAQGDETGGVLNVRFALNLFLRQPRSALRPLVCCLAGLLVFRAGGQDDQQLRLKKVDDQVPSVSGIRHPTSSDQSLPVLRHVSEVRKLSPEEAAKGYPVELTGTITLADPPRYQFFLQDDSGGIYLDGAGGFPDVITGRRGVVSGFTDPGEFAPQVAIRGFRVLGPGTFPDRRPMPLSVLMTGEQDSQWVTLRGVILKVSPQDGLTRLLLATGGGTVELQVPSLEANRASASGKYLDAEVVVSGVCGSIFDNRRAIIGVHLLVPSWSQVEVLHAGESDLARIPVLRIGDLLRFRPGAHSQHRTRVTGTVTRALGRETLFVQDGAEAIRVQLAEPADVRAGDRVELAGFPSVAEQLPLLQEAYAKVLARGQPLSARTITAETATNTALQGAWCKSAAGSPAIPSAGTKRTSPFTWNPGSLMPCWSFRRRIRV
jgi:hypothetical protein